MLDYYEQTGVFEDAVSDLQDLADCVLNGYYESERYYSPSPSPTNYASYPKSCPTYSLVKAYRQEWKFIPVHLNAYRTDDSQTSFHAESLQELRNFYRSLLNSGWSPA